MRLLLRLLVLRLGFRLLFHLAVLFLLIVFLLVGKGKDQNGDKRNSSPDSAVYHGQRDLKVLVLAMRLLLRLHFLCLFRRLLLLGSLLVMFCFLKSLFPLLLSLGPD